MKYIGREEAECYIAELRERGGEARGRAVAERRAAQQAEAYRIQEVTKSTERKVEGSMLHGEGDVFEGMSKRETEAVYLHEMLLCRRVHQPAQQPPALPPIF